MFGKGSDPSDHRRLDRNQARRIDFEETLCRMWCGRRPRQQWRTAFWPCQTDPCLQAADYCTWAIQRKWEKGDRRSYDLIKDKISYEYELWARGKIHYLLMKLRPHSQLSAKEAPEGSFRWVPAPNLM